MDNGSLRIINDTVEARREFGYNYGGFMIELSEDDIKQLLKGKCAAATISAEEYSIFIRKIK